MAPIFRFFVAIFLFCFSALANVSSRTSCSLFDKSDYFWVAIDFKVQKGDHVSAPVGNGKPLAPKFRWKTENIVVADSIWPKPTKILNQAGEDSGYLGYTEDFSILLSVKKMGELDNIEGEVFFVVCNDTCAPKNVEITVKADGNLPQEEIDRAILNKHSTNNFIVTLLLAFVGGIILNFMPCSFPVVSVKIFSLLKTLEKGIKNARRCSLNFAFGCISIFLIIGCNLLIVRSVGVNAGWGSFMQTPFFISCFSIIFVLAALSLFGIIHFSFQNLCLCKPFLWLTKRSARAVKKVDGETIKSFLSGAMMSLASATCVGPFVGIAVSFALLSHNILKSILIFTIIGFGVSFPFFIISFCPGLSRWIPKPGAWMETLQKIIGLLMLGACVWLYSILMAETEPQKVIKLMWLTIGIAGVSWLLETSKYFSANTWKKIATLVAIYLASGFLIAGIMEQEKVILSTLKWEPFSFEKLNQLKTEKKFVLLNFTADWCLNCKFNEEILSSKEIETLFAEKEVVCMKLDWTNRNNEIASTLSLFGATTVPLSVFFTPYDEPVIVSGILSKDKIKKIILR
jgi:thiol:disulfide interchange protein DsbD